jgi:hypothetical protein
LTAQDEARVNGTHLRLVIGPGLVLRLLTLLGFDQLLAVYPSLPLARAGYSAD